MWHLEGHPGLEYDEPVYSSVARNLAEHGELQVRESIGVDEPYLYHPPVYFYALAGVYWAVGVSLVHARLLAASMSVVSLLLLWLFARRKPGGIAGLVTLTLIATDAWIVYTNRVGWIENFAMPLMLGGLLLYDRALNYEAPRSRRGGERARRRRTRRIVGVLYVTAGIVMGAAVTVKFNSVVVLFAVAVHWTIVRRQGREHLHLFASAAVIIVGYITTMLLLEGPEFVRQNTAQFDRSTGTYASRGTVGLDVAVRAFTHNYALYVGTLLVVMYAVALIAARLIGALRRRSWARLRGPDSLYLAWSIASIVFLGALSLEISPLHDPHADPDLSLRGKSHCGLDARISLSLAPNSPPRRRRGPLVGECRRVPGTDSPRPRERDRTGQRVRSQAPAERSFLLTSRLAFRFHSAI